MYHYSHSGNTIYFIIPIVIVNSIYIHVPGLILNRSVQG